MPDVDLDAAHKAAAEATNGSGPALKLGGKRYPLKVSPPVVMAESYVATFGEGAGVDELRRFLGHALANPADVNKVIEAGFLWTDRQRVLDAWKVAEGESSASDTSSPKGGTRSRPTSPRRTPAKPRSVKASTRKR